MPSPLIMHQIRMPKDKPCKCDDCPLFAYLPKELQRPKSKYVRICMATSEYLSNRAGHLKVGKYCPMQKMSEKLTKRALKYADEQTKQLIEYKPNTTVEYPHNACVYFGLIKDPVQTTLTLK